MDKFPLTVVDDFYDDPDLVRDFALSQKFDITQGNYPGARTKSLEELDRPFFDKFCLKLFSLFYNTDAPNLYIEWNVSTAFCLIKPYDIDHCFIHTDSGGCIFGGIIYLNKEHSAGGTSVYKKIGDMEFPIRLNSLYEPEHYEQVKPLVSEWNKQFESTVDVSNVYNRLVGFDGETYHGAHITSTEEPRLTQVFFVRNMKSNVNFPLTRMRTIDE